MTPRTSSPHDGVALVTGAASGVGFAVAATLCREGKSVALCDRDEARLAAAASILRSEYGSELIAVTLDVKDRARVDEAVALVEHSLGPIDAAALVAGVLHLGSASEVTSEAWEESLRVNATGVFHMARAVVKRMVSRRTGALVTVASNAGQTPRLDMAAYAASKAAAIMFTKCLGLEVAHASVRCNVVCPGSTDTPMLRAMLGEPCDFAAVIAGNLQRYRLGIPLQRVASAQDIADVVSFLLSERARHITMQELCVDGGATL